MAADSSSFLRALLAHTPAPAPGRPGVVLGPPAAAPQGLVAHVAIEALLAERRVLHVSLDDEVEHVRARYDEVLRVAWGLSGHDHAKAALAVERRRAVLSYAGREPSPDLLRAHAAVLDDAARFRPDLLVADGAAQATWPRDLAALGALSGALGVPAWIAVTAQGPLPAAEPTPSFVVGLTPDGDRLRLALGTGDAAQPLPWVLDAATLTLVDGAPAEHAPPLRPSAVTLYTGGAAGAEAAFGEAAARHGLREVAFTFEGHRQEREVGRVELGPRELEAGDVSLVYVSRRLRREYNQHGLIRKVLQSLWHMVSRSQQVFVVGVVQADDTVVGGTGWSVELARMWGKEVWVYDQDRRGWVTWDGRAWTPGEPRITAAQVCGTGTRYLEDHGRQAIDALFARSFG